MNRNDEFNGWDAWKEYNKRTHPCFQTAGTLCVALTGDQVAITDIRIHYPEE